MTAWGRRTCRGKRRYHDHQQAMRALRVLQQRSRRQKVQKRAYECPRCGGWHLTSQDPR